MKDDLLIGDTPKARRRKGRLKELSAKGRIWKHMTLSDAEGLVARPDLEDFFVFTLVRNPWDRAVSYHSWLRAQSFDHQAVTLARRLAFSEFLNHPHTQASLAMASYGSYVALPDGREGCDMYLRLEDLAPHIERLEGALGFPIGPIPRLNPSERPMDYRSAYTDADAELLSELAAEDIKRFGYTF